MIELYHNPIRRAYRIIESKVRELNDEAVPQLAVRSVNNFTGPYGFVPILLFFEAIHQLGLPKGRPALSAVKRAVDL